MIDKIFAPLSILFFAIFVGYLAYVVNNVDLWIIVVLSVLLACYDFYVTLRDGETNGGNSPL